MRLADVAGETSHIAAPTISPVVTAAVSARCVATAPVLSVRHLSVAFGRTEIIHDLSLDVARGTALAIIGPNGSGKTVLLRALVGAIDHAGAVCWAPGTRIGYVPQKLDLERDLPVTGGDLLRARARLAHVGDVEIGHALDRVGLDRSVLRTLIGTLSGGQFQRLLVAVALLDEPTVLLLDEPTSGVDEPGQLRLNESLRALQVEHGVTVLTISHDLSVVYRYATEVLCLSRNHRCFGVPQRVLTPEVLSEVYGQPVGFFAHEDGR